MTATMTLTHILVDFENTQPSGEDIALLRGKDQRLWIFRGPSQKKYDAEFAEALLRLGDRVRIIKCEKSGRNALDMHIAFQIGRLLGELTQASDAPAAVSFVVVSRDTDYEPLLQYVRAQGYAATRVISVTAALGGASAEKAAAVKASKTKSSAPAAKTKPAKKAPAAKSAKATSKTSRAKGAAKAAAAPTETRASQSIEELVDDVVERLREHPKHRPTRLNRLESWLASHLRSKVKDDDIPAIVAALEKRGVVTLAGKKIEYPLWS
jgi:hypothetical protein